MNKSLDDFQEKYFRIPAY